MTAAILAFPDKMAAERASLIAQARSNYDSIFPATPPTTDGGKARIQRRRDNFKFRDAGPGADDPACDDLIMDHADPGYPSDVVYRAPERDPG